MLIILVGCISVLSLGSWLYCWNDVQKGRPNILSLRQITLIMDRHRLDALYGKHGSGYIYELSKESLQQINRDRRMFVYSEMLADGCCFFGVYRYFTGTMDTSLLPLFMTLAIAYQSLSLWYSMTLVKRWWHQIAEEMSGLE